MPYRTSDTINLETKNRIKNSSFVLSFSPDEFPSENLNKELNYADQINKPIVIAFDKIITKPNIPVKGQNVKFFQ